MAAIKCPECNGRIRVKPAPRTKPQQLWQCANCLGEWTNPMLQMAIEDKMMAEEYEEYNAKMEDLGKLTPYNPNGLI